MIPRGEKNKMKKLLMAAACCVVLTGCNVASHDPDAVWLELNFATPESFPFFEPDLYNFEDKYRINCIIWDCEKMQWAPTQGYHIYYEIWDGYPKKIEKYYDNKIHSCQTFIILPLQNRKKIKLKLTASSADHSFEPRYCITSVDDLTKLKEEEYDDIGYFLIFHYALSFVKIDVNIPPWNKWTNITEP